MKKFIRLASLAMAGLAVAACLASCGDDSGNKGTETTTASGASDSNSTVDKVKDLYGSLDYSGRKFRILALEAGEQWYNFISDTANEVWFEDARSWAAKLALIPEYGFVGAGIWNAMRPFTQGWLILQSGYRVTSFIDS